MVNELASVPEIQALTLELSESAITLRRQLSRQESGLRKIGAGLPRGTLKKLETVHNELKNLVTRIEDQQTELAQLRTLATTTELINSSLDLEEVLSEVMDRAIQLTESERGYIMLRDPKSGELQARVIRKLEATNATQIEEFIVSETIVRQVIDTGEAVITTNAGEDPRFMSQESIIGFALRSVICVPLNSREKTIGAVYCDNRIKEGVFKNKEKRLLTGFANQAAIAIENAQLFEQIKQALNDITEMKVLLDSILASIVNGVITTNAENLITAYNDASETILGLPRTATLEKWFHEVLPFIHSAIEATLSTVLEKEDKATVEADINIEGRGKRSLNLKLSPLKDAENSTQGVALVVDDLTELKQRDATLTAVRRYLPPAMVDNIQSIEKLGLGGVRQTVTVLFAEVRAFDTFPDTLSPIELMERLNTYLTFGSEAIHKYGGLIDKFMGNEIMAIFNTQLNPSDEHAWDAVQAALRMAADFRTMEAFGTLGEAPREKPYYRIGIHTGVATLGNVGSQNRREFSAIGDTVNLAKRLQENTVMGQIIISVEALETCRQQIDQTDWIELKPLEPIYVKGREKPAQVFEIYDAGV